MKTMKQFLLAGVMALAAMTLTTACSDKNDDDNGGSAWDAGKIAGDVAGTWMGQYDHRETVTLNDGRKLRGVKEMQAYKFNKDGTGTCYKYLINTAFEPIAIYGGSMDSKNGSFTWTTKEDSTITITRTGDGDSSNPKTWTAALTKDGLQVQFGSQTFTSDSAGEEQEEIISDWETKLRTGSNTSEIADSSFLVSWWKQSKVNVLTSGGLKEIETPWGDYSGTSTSQDIPSKQRFYNGNDSGWEMCFAHLTGDESTHWFALYNPNSAVLRVFFWVEDATEFGNELIFDVISQTEDELKYPLYHMMEYGIPANHKIKDNTLSKSANLTSESTTNSSTSTWEWFLSAYSTKSSNIKTSKNWHCFDLDMSAYIPGSTNSAWIDGIDNEYEPYFQIDACSQETSDVSLTGTLTGKISGTMETYKTEVQQSSSNATMSSWSNTLSNLSSMCSSVGMAAMQVSMLGGGKPGGGGGGDADPNANARVSVQNNTNVAQNPVNVQANAGGGGNPVPARQVDGPRSVPAQTRANAPTRFAISASMLLQGTVIFGTLCSLTSTVLNWANGTEYTTYVDTIPSKIDLDVDCDIDLSGSITTWKSNNAAAIDVTKGLLEDSNDSIIIGEGLWSLAEDPVIYIDKEDVLSCSKQFTVSVTKDGYKYSDIDEDSVRLVAWLDPTSIKINLNPDRYHFRENDTVKVNIGFGTAYNRDEGYTDCYRELMKLDDRPSFKFLDKSTVSKGDLIRVKQGALTTTEENAGYKLADVHCVQASPWTMANWYSEEFQNAEEYLESFQMVEMGSGDKKFYGLVSKSFGAEKVVFPQAFVGYDDDGNIEYPESPDFFVWVDVGFKCKEGEVELLKQFIPKIKLVTHDELQEKFDELKEYCTKSYNGEPVGTLANDESVNVYAPYGNIINYPYLKMLSEVINQYEK